MQFVQIEAITSSLQDEIICLRDHKFKLTFVVTILLFCISSIMCTNVSTKNIELHTYIDYIIRYHLQISLPNSVSFQAGMYILQLFDWYSSAIAVIVVCLVETIMVSYVYGIDMFMEDVEFMMNKRPSLYWKISWKYLTPLVMIVREQENIMHNQLTFITISSSFSSLSLLP